MLGMPANGNLKLENLILSNKYLFSTSLNLFTIYDIHKNSPLIEELIHKFKNQARAVSGSLGIKSLKCARVRKPGKPLTKLS